MLKYPIKEGEVFYTVTVEADTYTYVFEPLHLHQLPEWVQKRVCVLKAMAAEPDWSGYISCVHGLGGMSQIEEIELEDRSLPKAQRSLGTHMAHDVFLVLGSGHAKVGKRKYYRGKKWKPC